APAAGPEHPNGTTRIDHVVLVTPDLGRTVDALATVGLELRRTRDTDSPESPMRQAFFRIGEVILEVVGPPEPSDDGPSRWYGLAFAVDDLDALVDRLGEHVGAIKPAVQRGRRITTLRHRELGLSVATAFMDDPVVP
ncbi:MAG: hypothetical protein JWM05_3066, partial [Acidimicrobiales bacterium]|nr:hypothetical protein [Acidimicrobiales bacterium]